MTLGSLFLCGLLELAAISVPQAPQEAFREALDRVQGYMQRGRWKPAKTALDELLEEYREQPHVLVHYTQIADAYRQIAFWSKHERPEYEDLITGKLVSYRANTGQIKLRYDRENLGDFLRSGRGFVHPITFDGPFQVVIKGDAYPRGSARSNPTLVLLSADDRFYQIGLGAAPENTRAAIRSRPAYIQRIRGERSERLAYEASPKVQTGRPFQFKLEVQRQSIAVSYNGGRLVRAAREAGNFGQFGFTGIPSDSLTKIEITGKANSYWLDGLADVVVQQWREVFDRDYRASDHLPAWLLAMKLEAGRRELLPRTLTPAYPWIHDSDLRALTPEAERYAERGAYEQGLRFLADHGRQRLGDEFMLYFRALYLRGMGQARVAERLCRELLELNPDFARAERLWILLRVEQASHAEAAQILRSRLEQEPEDLEWMQELIAVLLAMGEFEPARTTLERAVALAPNDPRLQQWNRVLVKTERGPAWSKPYVHKTRYYEIRSNISLQVCQEAGNVLDEAYRGFTLHLKRIPDLNQRKFRVYLFGGEEGYLNYAQESLGARPENTAGLYSLLFKQLLIWNLPDRSEMMRTVRHEAFHQYLDRLMEDPPRWLNEGLAEYYENAGYEEGEWREDRPHREHLRVLRETRTRLVPLDRFVRQNAQQFYADPRLHYAQAWALVYFMRQGPSSYRALFQRLFERLLGDTRGERAMNEVFRDVDWAEMEREMAVFLAELPH